MSDFAVLAHQTATVGQLLTHSYPSCGLACLQIRFTDFHAAASVCTPSRAGLVTGRYGRRTGISGNFGPASKYGLSRDELTIANVLGDNGVYQTHMIGYVLTHANTSTTPGTPRHAVNFPVS